MTTATFVAHCASEEYDENERLRRRATARRRWGLGFSYLALILVTILMVFPCSSSCWSRSRRTR